mgnify:CR=1 FL=1
MKNVYIIQALVITSLSLRLFAAEVPFGIIAGGDLPINTLPYAALITTGNTLLRVEGLDENTDIVLSASMNKYGFSRLLNRHSSSSR